MTNGNKEEGERRVTLARDAYLPNLKVGSSSKRLAACAIKIRYLPRPNLTTSRLVVAHHHLQNPTNTHLSIPIVALMSCFFPYCFQLVPHPLILDAASPNSEIAAPRVNVTLSHGAFSTLWVKATFSSSGPPDRGINLLLLLLLLHNASSWLATIHDSICITAVHGSKISTNAVPNLQLFSLAAQHLIFFPEGWKTLCIHEITPNYWFFRWTIERERECLDVVVGAT